MDKAIKQCQKHTDNTYVLLVVLSDDILQMHHMNKQDLLSVNQPSIPVCLSILDILTKLNQNEMLPGKVIFVSLFTTTSVRFKEVFPEVKAIHCIAEQLGNELGCQLKLENLKLLVKDIYNSLGLSHKYGSMCQDISTSGVTANTLTRDLNELLKVCVSSLDKNPRANKNLYIPPDQLMAHRCMYNVTWPLAANEETSFMNVYPSIVMNNNNANQHLLNGTSPNTHPGHPTVVMTTNPPVAMTTDRSVLRTNNVMFHGNGHTDVSNANMSGLHMDKEQQEDDGVYDSGFVSNVSQYDSMTITHEEEQVPLMKQKKFDFIPPDDLDEEECENISQGILELNREAVWRNKSSKI